jgi:hypothetical protein
MKIDRNALLTIALATAVGGLIVVWLTPFFKKLPPRDLER